MKTKEMPAVAHGFIKYLQSKNLTQNTQNGYCKDVIKFLQWCGNDAIHKEKKDILKYLAHLKKRNLSSQTRNLYLNSIKHYFNHLLVENLIHKNPCNFIKIRGVKRKYLYHIYKPEELTQLADDYYNNFIRNYDDSKLPENRKITSKLSKERNHIILQLLINQGLNTAEIARITLEDIDLNKATIKIKGTKKSNERNIPLQASQIGSIIQYQHQTRPQFIENYEEETDQLILLLPEHQGQKRIISYKYSNLFLNLGKNLKTINNTFNNFNQIRASIITNWIKTEGLRKAQYLAGHRYISSTEKFKTNDLESLTDDLAKFHPF